MKTHSSNQIIFNVTENIKKLGIKEFTLRKKRFSNNMVRWKKFLY